MQTYIRPFMPDDQLTASAAVLSTSTTVTIPVAARGVGNRSIRVLNAGSDIVWIRIMSSAGAGTATIAASMPMLPNTVEVFFLPRECTVITAVTNAAGTNTLYITAGESA